jgi:hypothetical protein
MARNTATMMPTHHFDTGSSMCGVSSVVPDAVGRALAAAGLAPVEVARAAGVGVAATG